MTIMFLLNGFSLIVCFGTLLMVETSKRNIPYTLVICKDLCETPGQGLRVRSLLECSQTCTTASDCCGFIYDRGSRNCHWIIDSDLQKDAGTSHGETHIYLDDRCAVILQDLQHQSTSTATTSTTTPVPSTTTSTTSSVPSTTTSTTTPVPSTTTSTTTPAPSTTTSTTTPVPSTTTSTTTPVPSTTTSTTTPSTTTPSTTPVPSTTTSTIAPVPSTTTSAPTSTQTSSTTPIPSCSILAIVCLSSEILALSSTSVFHFNNYAKLTSGSTALTPFTDMFSRTQGDDVISAYSSNSGIHLVTDAVVQKYDSSTFTYIGESSYQDHFGVDINVQIDAILIRETGELYLFSGDVLYIISSSGGTTTKKNLNSNAASNPFKSKNHGDRPKQITAACNIDIDTDLFVSDGEAYTFTFSRKQWNNMGQIVCY